MGSGTKRHLGICPWSGAQCPGVFNCMPAVFADKEKPECPIVVLVENASVISAGFALQLQKAHEDSIRAKVEERVPKALRDLQIDQLDEG